MDEEADDVENRAPKRENARRDAMVCAKKRCPVCLPRQSVVRTTHMCITRDVLHWTLDGVLSASGPTVCGGESYGRADVPLRRS